MMTIAPTRRTKPSEQGYILVAVMFLLALLIISMVVAIPKISADIQRDRELETYHRGMQYRRAIQLYYRKFNAYPPNVDALVKTNEIRFLRKRYIDPITGKDDWKPIMFGQNKTPLAMGFFGQPLGGVGTSGLVGAGIGPQGGNSIPGATPIGASPTDPTAGTAGTTAIGSTASTTNPTDPTAAAGQGTPGANPTGPTFGGAGIIGFSPASPKQSLIVYKKKNHYNEWEFTYSPLSEMTMMGGMTTNTGVQGTGSSTTSPTGINPTPTPTPTPQQQ